MPILQGNRRQLVIDDIISSYTIQGEGDDILLLHGWGCQAKIFDNIQSILSKNYRVIAVDFPGFGASEEPKTDWGCLEYANWTLSLMQKLKIINPIILGHSFGGRIALILNAKINVKKIILTGSAGLILTSNIKKKEFNGITHCLKTIFERILPKVIFEYIRNVFITQIGSLDYKNASPKMKQVLKKVISQDLKDYALKINLPTLLIWGENDKDTPLKIGEAFNKIIPQSELKIISACGHYAFLEKETEFLHLITDFLKL